MKKKVKIAKKAPKTENESTRCGARKEVQMSHDIGKSNSSRRVTQTKT